MRRPGILLLGLGLIVLTAAAPTAEQDRQAMLERLGISQTRPGADGNNRNAPNAANYDEAKAQLMGPLPDPLLTDDGRPVRSAADWWRVRRPQIVEAFDRELYGRVPATAPAIRWRVVSRTDEEVGGVRVVTRRLEGVADNSVWPSASATLALRVTLPVEAKRPVPAMLAFGLPDNFRFPGTPPPLPPEGVWTEQLIRRGWGYAVLVANSIQADDGAGLADGVIGISLRGRPRQPEDWGVLRAWAWGASRAMDRLAADPAIDARRIGIEGLSRYGKAALVTMAYDERFAIGFIGSSGAGGAKLYRRDFGERVGNLADGLYYWFAGNFLKYAGPLRETDLPVDSHELIALAAPRPIFIGAGTIEQDGWVDPKGSFDAAMAASSVYRLLGKPGLSPAAYPGVGPALIDGTIGFRQHPGGHTNAPNWKTFLDFAEARLAARRYFDAVVPERERSRIARNSSPSYQLGQASLSASSRPMR